MRILLTGANGQVGHALRASLAPLGEVVCATRDGKLADDGSACQVADLDQPDGLANLIERLKPEVVVNAAAYTAVDRAESEPDAAFRANAEAVGAMAAACAKRGALLVHYSTDYVFPGNDPRPRREDDPTEPLNVYGASKLAGEEAIRASGCQHLLFRVSWVYSARGHNFLRTMLRLAEERDKLHVVDDQIGAPTPAHWIAEATARAIAVQRAGDNGGAVAPASGTWHLAPTGETSWHGFAEAIFNLAVAQGLVSRRPLVLPITSSEYPAPARRPARSLLDASRMQRDFGIGLPHWHDGLVQVLADLKR